MDDNSMQNLALSLKNVLQYCRNIRQLLDNDKTNFGKNALSEVANSNQKKNFMLEKLTTLVNEMNTQFAPNGGNFLQTIEMNILNSHTELKKELLPLITELKTEITEAYQLLMINNDIVVSNLQHINSIWEKLIELRVKNEGLYDHTGSIGA